MDVATATGENAMSVNASSALLQLENIKLADAGRWGVFRGHCIDYVAVTMHVQEPHHHPIADAIEGQRAAICT